MAKLAWYWNWEPPEIEAPPQACIFIRARADYGLPVIRPASFILCDNFGPEPASDPASLDIETLKQELGAICGEDVARTNSEGGLV